MAVWVKMGEERIVKKLYVSRTAGESMRGKLHNGKTDGVRKVRGYRGLSIQECPR